MDIEVVDRIENQETEEKLAEEQREKLFDKLVMGKDATGKVETSRGVFTVKFPKPIDKLKIGNLEAARRNYRPAAGFSEEADMINTLASTLDVLVVSGPKWFMDLKEANKNFSFLEVPSQTFLLELFGKAHSFREDVEQRIDEAGKPADQRIPSRDGDEEVVDSGSYGSFTDKPGSPQA